MSKKSASGTVRVNSYEYIAYNVEWWETTRIGAHFTAFAAATTVMPIPVA